MAKRRPAGDGMVRKREDGRWEGRIVVGHKKNGTPIFQHAYAHTQKELTEKLHQNIERYQDVELTEDSRPQAPLVVLYYTLLILKMQPGNENSYQSALRASSSLPAVFIPRISLLLLFLTV